MLSATETSVITIEVRTKEWPEELANTKSCPFVAICNEVAKVSDVKSTEQLKVTSISQFWIVWNILLSPNEEITDVFFSFSNELSRSLPKILKEFVLEKEIKLLIERTTNRDSILLKKFSSKDPSATALVFEMPSSAQIVSFLSKWAVFLDRQNSLRFYNTVVSTNRKEDITCIKRDSILSFKTLLQSLEEMKIEENKETNFIRLICEFYLKDCCDISKLDRSEIVEYNKYYSSKKASSNKGKLLRTRSAPILSKVVSRNRRTASQHKKRKRFITGFTNLSIYLSGSPPEDPSRKATCDNQTLGILNYKRAQLGVRRRRFREFCYLGISYKEVDIAKIITSRTSELYLQIKFENLLSERTRKSSSCIRMLTESFNSTSWWVINYILNKRRKDNFTFTEDVIDRKFRLTLMISVAEELRRLNNFHSFFAVMAGLNQPHLDWIWAFVKEKHKIKFQDLNRAVKSDNGYIVYEADLSKTGSSFHIPYLGVTSQKLFALESVQKESDEKTEIDFDLYCKRYKLINDYLKGQQYHESQQSIRYEAKLNDLINNQFDIVETAGEEQLLTLSKNEKRRASKGIITRLQNSGFM